MKKAEDTTISRVPTAGVRTRLEVGENEICVRSRGSLNGIGQVVEIGSKMLQKYWVGNV